ncbi:hypothetical protein QTP88_017118 [Uroleucon formosanum]
MTHSVGVVALESIQVLSNANENNEVIIEKQNEDGEEQIIEKQTKTRQTSISQKKKESLHNLKIQAKKLTEMPKKRFRQGNIWESVKTPDEDRALNDLRCILGIEDVPTNLISLREAARSFSNSGASKSCANE